MFKLREIRDRIAQGLTFSEAKQAERQAQYQTEQTQKTSLTVSERRVRPAKTKACRTCGG
jgi:hypothetical protein